MVSFELLALIDCFSGEDDTRDNLRLLKTIQNYLLLLSILSINYSVFCIPDTSYSLIFWPLHCTGYRFQICPITAYGTRYNSPSIVDAVGAPGTWMARKSQHCVLPSQVDIGSTFPPDVAGVFGWHVAQQWKSWIIKFYQQKSINWRKYEWLTMFWLCYKGEWSFADFKKQQKVVW